MTIPKISEAENEVMQILWSSSNNLTSTSIIEHLSSTKNWKPSTIWTFIKRLTEKGFIKIMKDDKLNYYVPSISQEEYRAQETVHFLNEVHGGSLVNLFASLSSGSLSQHEIEELKTWLSEQKEN